MNSILLRLRRKLTALNAVVSGCILVAMACGAFFYTRAQSLAGAENEFAHMADTIAYQLQSDTLVRHSYLTNTELSQSFVIHIEDGGSPIQWMGVYATRTPRETLIKQAKAIAQESGILFDEPPLQYRNLVSTMTGEQGDSYRLSVRMIPAGSGWTALIVLKDRALEQEALARTAWVFAGCIALGIAAQTLFSYAFSRRAVRPIAQAQQEQKYFIQAASHELRTPLAVLSASAEAIPMANAREAEQFAGTIREQSRQMARLVDDLLLLSSEEARAMPMSMAPLETDELIETVARGFEGMMKDKELCFKWECKSGAVLWADASRISQVLAILLQNAMDHTPQGGEILLSGTSDKGWYRFSVADSGPGIDDAHKSKVFDAFYRVDKARSRQGAHYGLGLSIASRIVQRHGGTIAVTDRTERGSVFTVSLPMEHPQSEDRA